MLKPNKLQASPAGTAEPVPIRRPRLVFSQPDSSGAGVSNGLTARILIVEDDYLASGEMEVELTGAGFEVVGVATSAQEAVALAVAERPHLVIMDIRLEGAVDGVAAAIEIFEACGIRSLFASAHHDQETQRRAESCSPLGWLAKPYMMSALVEAVRSALRELGHSSERS
jgi:two-component system, response regulator PdtaR